MDKIRIGVIGLRFGQWHVRTLANMPEAQLVAIADRASGPCPKVWTATLRVMAAGRTRMASR